MAVTNKAVEEAKELIRQDYENDRAPQPICYGCLNLAICDISNWVATRYSKNPRFLFEKCSSFEPRDA